MRAQVAPEGGWGGLRQAPLEAVLTAIVGPFVLSLFRRLDGRVDSGALARRSRPWPARWPQREPQLAMSAGSDEMEIAGQDAELPEIRRRARYLALFVLVAVRRDRRAGSSTSR